MIENLLNNWGEVIEALCALTFSFFSFDLEGRG